ncbi:MAG: pyruvate kinase, partial [Verrucomicrobia bacterium]|nr:pyruvate kinase [Verrucomicrobiota bacterium]
MKSLPYRHTKIVFTIGPATNDAAVLEELLHAGVDVCRLNMAHATREWTAEALRNVDAACKAAGRRISIMMDIKGPEIRTGHLEEALELQRGEAFDFFIDPGAEPVLAGVRGVAVNYPRLLEDIEVGNTILVDSGLLRLRVEEIMEDRVRCSVRISGPLGSRRHINLPGVHVKLPALTEKDHHDIDIGIEQGVDFFALSFVRTSEDLETLRRTLAKKGSRAQIIAKIEDQSAISNLDDIIASSDGLMVARGDLGIEIPYETLPLVQRRAIRTCQRMGKPAIVATHMLESMIQNPLPTRAEISDIANAVDEQADAIMLSGETTVGKYPVECVHVMNRIIRAVQAQGENRYNDQLVLKTAKARMLKAAMILSDEIGNSFITVFTRRGILARTLSALRPLHSPVFAFTDDEAVFKNLLLYWGVEPFFMEFEEDFEQTILNAYERLKTGGWARKGDSSVIITNVLAR